MLVLRHRRRGTGNHAHGLVHNGGFDPHADRERATAFAEGNAELKRLQERVYEEIREESGYEAPSASQPAIYDGGEEGGYDMPEKRVGESES